jgi:hypothetical protein
VQFTDLRSQVVKEASLTIACIARSLGRGFISMASQIVMAMLRILKTNKGVMYGAANEALLEVADHCHSAELVGIMCAGSEDKHPSVREHVMRYLARMLSAPGGAELSEAATEQTETALRRTVSDASAPVRAEAKLAFYSYKRAFPVEAALLLSSLEPAVQKKLETAPPAAPQQQQPQLQQQPQRGLSGSVRDRILSARVHAAVVPVACAESLEGERVAADAREAREATPPKSHAAEHHPTPAAPAGRRAGVVHMIRPPPVLDCPPSTPVCDATVAESPSALLAEAAAALRRDWAPQCPGSTPTGERLSVDQDATASPSALLKHVSSTLQQQFNEESKSEEPQPEQQVLLPAVLEEMPTFESARKGKKTRRTRGHKENASTTTTTTTTTTAAAGAAPEKPTKTRGAKKNTTPIAKRTRNRKGATVK